MTISVSGSIRSPMALHQLAFLATRVLKHLGDDFQTILPKAAYVHVSGADSLEEVLNIISDVSFILKQGILFFENGCRMTLLSQLLT